MLDGAGQLSAHTTNGNVWLELSHLGNAAAGGAMSVESVNGSVLLALAPNAGADLEIQSLNGDFSSELPVALQSSRSPQRVHGRLGEGGTAVRLRTVNGGIRIVMARATI